MPQKLLALVPCAAVAALVFGALSGAAPLGQLTEFSAGLNPGAAPFRVVAAPDGAVWFTDQGTTKAIGRITTAGAITEAALPAGSVPRQIRVGADGNIWFTDTNPAAPLIGRINSDGAITSFALPAGSFPNALAVGDDDALWITDRGTTPAIRRLTVAGTLTSYRAGLNAGALPNGIAPGADGALWFTDQGAPRSIGRIALDGTITETNAGLNAGTNPAAISSGPDGNLYFTDQGTTKAIGKISLPSGTITETALASNANPQEVTAGADGNLWYTDRGAVKQLASIAPDGTITLRPAGIPPTSSPGGVRTGPDGNLWYVDNGAPQAIARYGVGAPAASIAPPSVTGGGGVGKQQSCAGATWSDWAGMQPSLTRFGFDGYRWYRDGVAVAGQTGSTFMPAAADVGRQLSCSVTVTYTLFPVTTTSSSAAVPVRDVSPPVLDLPAAITANATAPDGTVVHYAVSASDDVDGAVVPRCSPASGSIFAIGTTSVVCTATDVAGNTSTGGFVVLVRGAAEQLADLVAAVGGVGPGKSLAAKLTGGCGALGAFAHEVRAQSGKSIAAETASALLADAARIGSVLGC